MKINAELLQLSPEAWEALKPLLFFSLGILVLLLVMALWNKVEKWVSLFGSIVLLMGTAWLGFNQLGSPSVTLFSQKMVWDSFAQIFTLLIIFSTLVVIISSVHYLEREKLHFGEFHLLLLFSALGMIFLVSALDFIVLFIALELMSLTVYTLVAFRRYDRRANEASIKYFILGGVGSAILLYGAALLYGATGTTLIHQMGNADHTSYLFQAGYLFVLVGFLFKIAAVPFHMWSPDVYEGASIPVTSFMATALKASAFAALIRFLMLTSSYISLEFLGVFAFLAMIAGNLFALSTTSVKRIVAYTSISHTGYLLLGILSAIKDPSSIYTLTQYLIAYVLMTLALFTLLTFLFEAGDFKGELQDLSGLSEKHPVLAFAFLVILFSMAGVPPTFGFFAKYQLLFHAVKANYIALTLVAVFSSVIGAGVYLKALVYIYMKPEVYSSNFSFHRLILAPVGVLFLLIFSLLYFGMFPSYLLTFAKFAKIGV